MSVIGAVIGILVVAQIAQFLLIYALALRIRATERTTGAPEAVPLPSAGTKVMAADELPGSLGEAEASALARIRSSEAMTVAVLSPSCQPCKSVADLIARRRRPVESLLVVAVGDDDRIYERQLRSSATVISVQQDSAFLQAFGPLDAFPTLIRTLDGTVVASDFRPAFLES